MERILHSGTIRDKAVAGFKLQPIGVRRGARSLAHQWEKPSQLNCSATAHLNLGSPPQPGQPTSTWAAHLNLGSQPRPGQPTSTWAANLNLGSPPQPGQPTSTWAAHLNLGSPQPVRCHSSLLTCSTELPVAIQS